MTDRKRKRERGRREEMDDTHTQSKRQKKTHYLQRDGAKEVSTEIMRLHKT